MPIFESHTSLLVVFFIYGLAFFSMGIALTLELNRSPLLTEQRVLRPLAIFGLLHGIHEWAEIYIMQRVWLGQPFPTWVSWFRVGWLTLSFIPLILYAVIELGARQQSSRWYLGMALGFLLVFILLALWSLRLDHPDRLQHVDNLARYLLAVPGGLLACLALFSRARQLEKDKSPELARYSAWSAVGFGLYGLTQVFVPVSDMFPANWLNAGLFQELTHLPIQLFRAIFAVLITIYQLRVIQTMERERQGQLLSAQQARLEALEQVQQELLARETLRRNLLRHIVRVQEDERARIARELHDETAQLLTAISLNLATLKQSVEKRSAVKELVDRLQDLARQMSQGIYRMVHDLRPAQLDDLGLVPALQYLVDQVRQQSGLQVNLLITGDRRKLDPLVETVIFRVAQEALSNVSRHAQVQQAMMYIIYNPEIMLFRVKDEGIGFDLEKDQTPPHGWGLLGMRERVESVGGRFSIESIPGKGTRVEAAIPIEHKPPDQVSVSGEENVV